jgi:hypothetical protein
LSGSAALSVRNKEYQEANDEDDGAVDLPFGLPGHETLMDHIDPLKKPYRAKKHENYAHNIQHDFHISPLQSIRRESSFAKSRRRIASFSIGAERTSASVRSQ